MLSTERITASGSGSEARQCGQTTLLDSCILSTVPGRYTVTYAVTDRSGNQAVSQTRTVVVADTQPPVTTLNDGGNNGESGGDAEVPMLWEACTTWEDPGVLVRDAFDDAYGWAGDPTVTPPPITLAITAKGSVDTCGPLDEPTQLVYTATDAAGNIAAAVKRHVVLQDTLPPQLYLFGNELVSLPPGGMVRGDLWVDPGGYALDRRDGNISGVVDVETLDPGVALDDPNKVYRSGYVAMQEQDPPFGTVGEYTIVYFSLDREGNRGTATRKVRITTDSPASGSSSSVAPAAAAVGAVLFTVVTVIFLRRRRRRAAPARGAPGLVHNSGFEAHADRERTRTFAEGNAELMRLRAQVTSTPTYEEIEAESPSPNIDRTYEEPDPEQPALYEGTDGNSAAPDGQQSNYAAAALYAAAAGGSGSSYSSPAAYAAALDDDGGSYSNPATYAAMDVVLNAEVDA